MDTYEECGVGVPWDEDEDENSLCALKGRASRAVYRLWDEARWPGPERNYSLEQELQTFRGELDRCLDAMPPHEARKWLMENVGALQSILARTERERWHALRVLVWMRGGLALTADFLAEASAPPNDPPPTDDDDEDDDDDGGEGDFCAPAVREIVAAYRHTAMSQRDLLLARLRNAAARLGAEAACFASWDPDEVGLNADLGRFVARAEFCLRGICPLEAQTWLSSHVGELEVHARNRQEYDQARQVLAGLSDRLFGLIYEIAREK